MTPAVPAIIVLHLLVAAGCVLAAARRPAGGRMAATGVAGALALASVAIAIPFFTYASEPGQAETIGAAVASMLGAGIIVAGAVLGGLAVVVHRGRDGHRRLVAGALAAVAGLSMTITLAQASEAAEGTAKVSLMIAAAGLTATAGAALLIGAEVGARRR
jgi:hypothetical protein